ncbi:uncharacterized protein B0H18DRAFT_1120494 [Fomitopsis serialis]|uniref:uncharacterized protein n=1 Tax=Fomitopsis serialis TaxID=139415 RepID=UPI0020071EB8|nr:uncharacterized protein B0H18DRAFT_1120494 [Neoantrodia serialis]KAH9923227.1 hypothetical protein B0H18DRAFT_1120494 [Neoantrodia serialis]
MAPVRPIRQPLQADREEHIGRRSSSSFQDISPSGISLALADAEKLLKRIERLRERGNKLEDALRTLRAAVSDEPHPLLREESAMDTSPSSGSSGTSPSGPLLTHDDEEPEILDTLGTLTLGIRGEARFFSQTPRSEYLIHIRIPH